MGGWRKLLSWRAPVASGELWNVARLKTLLQVDNSVKKARCYGCRLSRGQCSDSFGAAHEASSGQRGFSTWFSG